MSADLLKAISVTAELTGTELSRGAVNVMLDDLAEYPLGSVLAALTRCRRELKGRLTLADILTRIDDGRPGTEKAWSMIPQDEANSCVWTDEMQAAYGAASPLLANGDTVAARMAFKETYEKLVQLARDQKKPVHWNVSFGFDVGHRESVLLEAIDRKYITSDRAMELLPGSEKIARTGSAPALSDQREKIKQLTSSILKPAQPEPEQIEYDEAELLKAVKVAEKKVIKTPDEHVG